MSDTLQPSPIQGTSYPGEDLSSVFELPRVNRPVEEDAPVHSWYSFVLSFPPHLVRHYLHGFGLRPGDTVLDPFCGTGTTLVETKRYGLAALGIEANPFAHFATTVKIDWSVSPAEMRDLAGTIAGAAEKALRSQGIDDSAANSSPHSFSSLRVLPLEAQRLLIDNSISPLPLHKALVLLDEIERYRHRAAFGHALLAFADALVYAYSNLRFGPEVGIGRPKANTPVLAPWLDRVHRMSRDLEAVSSTHSPPAVAFFADARNASAVIEPATIDAVITSPPYPNEKDYTRTTRLESVLLGFISSREELREFKAGLVRSNTRGVYKGDDDDRWVEHVGEIQAIAQAIEQRRVELGKTSGFERLYPRVTRLYFGGMARHLRDLSKCLRPGAWLAYVVGDQASYLRIMIPTGRLLASIATSLGYSVRRIDLFRSRFSTATKTYLREEVVVMRWEP